MHALEASRLIAIYFARMIQSVSYCIFQVNNNNFDPVPTAQFSVRVMKDCVHAAWLYHTAEIATDIFLPTPSISLRVPASPAAKKSTKKDANLSTLSTTSSHRSTSKQQNTILPISLSLPAIKMIFYRQWTSTLVATSKPSTIVQI